MDDARVRKKLNTLRQKHYGEDIPRFCRSAGLNDSNVRQVAFGDSMPTVPNMEKWVKSCGLSGLGEFFTQIEAEERGEAPEPNEASVQDFRRLLTVIDDPVSVGAILQLLRKLAEKPPLKNRRR